MTPFLDHYRVREIPVHRFCHLLREIYDVLTKRADPLVETIWCGFTEVEEPAFLLREAVEELHMNLAECFLGWVGVDSYLDVVNERMKVQIAWKSPFRTDDDERNRLQGACINGYTVYVVNDDGTPDLKGISLQKAYEILSGRESFWKDLKSTLLYIFKTFKTYHALIAEIS